MTAGRPPLQPLSARRFAEALAAVVTRMAAAHRAVSDGAAVDLADLGREVAALCQIARSLPSGQGRDAVRQLEAVQQDLDALVSAFDARYGTATPPAPR